MDGVGDEIREVARAELGYEQLRPGQQDAVEALLADRDVLAVMPTGAGKTAIYQLAGLLIGGATLVVSPLIALQRDQLEGLEESDAAAAAELNSTLSDTRHAETLDAFAAGDVEFLLLAPEQFANEETLARLREAPPSLLVVDEAHCISEWGHDFRPDYLRLGGVIEDLGHPRVLALTATAAPTVRREIVERLRMREPEVIVKGFDRPNIHLAVKTFHDEEAKLAAVVDRVAEATRPGIVYAATRRGAEELAEALEQRGISAAAYHAGLAKGERAAVQDSFMADDLEAVVATIAFGMGIDKPNVRFVFHADISDSVDSYYQEVGRVGRDGDRADAILFYRAEDVGLRRFFGGTTSLTLDEVEAVAEAVAATGAPLEPTELRDETGLPSSKVTAALNRLEEAGAVEILPSGEIAPGDGVADAAEAVEAQEARREYDRSRVEMMRAYAELRDCRREFLLNYFGEPRDEPCGFCDNCDAGVTVEDEERPLALGSRVRHQAWGVGTLQRYEGDKLVVLFDEVGYKTLAVDLVEKKALLTPEG